MKKTLLLLIILMLAGPAHAWQQVVVEAYSEEGITRGELRDKAMKSGFRQAVSQDMDRIISGWLSRERKSALMEHISGSIQGLVQGYRQVSWKENDDAVILEMEVNIDTDSLRSLLQNTGAYYTSDSSWPYDLNTGGASPEDFSLLRELQLVTGTVVDGNAATILSLNKTADGLWNGSIVHDDISMSAAGSDLDQVWFELWEYFFSRPGIKSHFVENLTLATAGWHTTDSIKHFDGILETWNREVEHKKIKSVYSGVQSIEAVWEIQSLSPELLKEKLENHLPAREINYQIKH